MNSKFFLMLLILPLCFSCGRKGQLIPPEALVPATVGNLQVQQQGESFRISWSAPGKEQSGRPLRDLAGFRLLRRELLPGGQDCAACSDAWQLIATVDLELPLSVEKSGGSYIFRDREVKPAASSQYRLVAFSKSDGISRPVTSLLKKFLPPPLPPQLTATTTPTAIRLELKPGGTAPPEIAGYNIYRRSAAEPPPPLPLNRSPLPGPVYEDMGVAYGSSYRYAATLLLKSGDDLVESEPSPEIEVLFSEPQLR